MDSKGKCLWAVAGLSAIGGLAFWRLSKSKSGCGAKPEMATCETQTSFIMEPVDPEQSMQDLMKSF